MFLISCVFCCAFISSVFSIFDKNYHPKLTKHLHELGVSEFNDSSYILPKNLKPTCYNLTILPSLNTASFKGWVEITFDVVNETNIVVLNGRFDSIQPDSLSASIKSINQNAVVVNTTVDQVHHMVMFEMNSTLSVEKGVNISIYYEGSLVNDMHGFYLSTYNTTDMSGSVINHLVAITQFESTFARRAFPCFDEPAYRAPFIINIYRLANQTSISNMPIESSTLDTNTNLILDIYQITPPIPTYLVAFGVSDLVNHTDNQTLRVFAREAVIQDAAYTLSVGQAILDQIGNFTQIKYPLPKMDVVAVPDFSAGAMENWGLTTYREKYVLYDHKKNTWRDKFMVLSVVAHEFSHQWFGDLVTPQWWDYAWLNEAFATYFEYTTSNQLAPEWEMGSTMYVVAAVQYALALDIGNPRPMTSPVYMPVQIEDLFDYVIYEKGGSILRMTENFLTTRVWREGLHRYLTANANSTGNPGKLFRALQNAANASSTDVIDTLQSWTTQPGYPLITVKKVTCFNSNNLYYITQAPYALESNFSSLRWNVPLTYTTQDIPEFDASKANKFWLYPTNLFTSLVTINSSGWVIFNIDQVGFYRINYDDDNWSKLIVQLNSNFSVIGSINRAQLLDDAFHLALTGHLNYSMAFRLCDYLPKENTLAPWNAFFTNMRFLINQFYNTSTGEGLKQYARSIVAAPFLALSADLSQSVSSFQGSMVVLAAGQFACDIGLPNCENDATNFFGMWRQNRNTLIPEVMQTVICTGLRLDTSVEAFQDVLDYYLNSDNAAEKLTVMNSMGCVTNQIAMFRYLDVVCDVNANHVRLQDRYIAFTSLVSHQTAISPVLQYITKNFNKVSDALGSRIDAVMSKLASTISQEAHVIQIKNIVNDTKVDQKLRDSLSSVVLPAVIRRQSWAATQQATDLKAWVNTYFKSSASVTSSNIMFILISALYIVLYF